MKTILLIIDGISLPFHVIDHAIKQAKSDGSGILVLFLKGEREQSAGYGYPSDLNAAENITTEAEATKEDEAIISANMGLIKTMISSNDILYKEMLLTEPSAEKIATIASTTDLVMLDAEFDNKAWLSSKITLDELTETIIVPVKKLSALPGRH